MKLELIPLPCVMLATGRPMKRAAKQTTPEIPVPNRRFSADGEGPHRGVHRIPASARRTIAELKLITQPTLVINGNKDIMIPTINSFTLSQHIPNAQLIVYPDSGHASQFQYSDL